MRGRGREIERVINEKVRGRQKREIEMHGETELYMYICTERESSQGPMTHHHIVPKTLQNPRCASFYS